MLFSNWRYLAGMRFLGFLLVLLLPLTALAQQTWVTDTAGSCRQVRTLAGDSIVGAPGDAGMTARIGFLTGIAVADGTVYVADDIKNRILQLNPTTGALCLLAGGPSGFADGVGAAARFDGPDGLAADGAGHLYVADMSNHRIRQIDLATGAVTTLAGSGQRGFADGPAATAQFDRPLRVAADSLGNVYVTEATSRRIRQIVAGSGTVRTLAGGRRGFADGTGATARFNKPWGLALDGKGHLYVADYGSHRIRRVVLTSGAVTTVAGSGRRGLRDGPAAVARFNRPAGLAAGPGVLYLTDQNNHRVCQLDLPTGTVRTLAGTGLTGFDDGPGQRAKFIGPAGIATAKNGVVYVIDVNFRIRAIE